MESDVMRIYEPVARTRGMKRAAESLNTVQSNVTARIGRQRGRHICRARCGRFWHMWGIA